MTNSLRWPDGKDFAFTIFDDPDLDTVHNVRTVYSFLGDLGLRTTKAVWPIRGGARPYVGGTTCEDRDYLQCMRVLQEKGFEIALHNVTYHTSIREETSRGLDVFRQLFGHYPFSMANHTGCSESIYWGRARVSGTQRVIYDLLRLKPDRHNSFFQGHIENSPLFWGDLCQAKIKYVRNFALSDINTLKACPAMPYRDPARPYVNYWFAASEGPSLTSFNKTLSEANQDRLASEGGACIIYTHLASGFVERGKLNGRFKSLMERISSMNGWFVPVHTLLDYILQVRGEHTITRAERIHLERKWLWHKVFHTNGRS
jgi:hypothetical protein